MGLRKVKGFRWESRGNRNRKRCEEFGCSYYQKEHWISLNQPGSFPNVDPVKKANFLAFGEGRAESLSKKYQAEIDKKNIDKGFKDLKEKFTVGDEPDYTAMRKELRSHDFQKDYTLPQIEAIERGINAEEGGYLKDKKVAHDKEESDIQTKISLGTATQKDNKRYEIFDCLTKDRNGKKKMKRG